METTIVSARAKQEYVQGKLGEENRRDRHNARGSEMPDAAARTRPALVQQIRKKLEDDAARPMLAWRYDDYATRVRGMKRVIARSTR